MEESKILDEEAIGKLKQDLATFIKSNKTFIRCLAILKIAELGYANSTDGGHECYFQLSSCEKFLTELNVNSEQLLNGIEHETDFKKLYDLVDEMEKQFSTVGAGVVLYAEFREKEFQEISKVTKYKIDPYRFSKKNCKNYLRQFVDFSKLLLDMYDTDLFTDIFCAIKGIAIKQEELEII